MPCPDCRPIKEENLALRLKLTKCNATLTDAIATVDRMSKKPAPAQAATPAQPKPVDSAYGGSYK
jgi:hypothetical protein